MDIDKRSNELQKELEQVMNDTQSNMETRQRMFIFDELTSNQEISFGIKKALEILDDI